MYSALWRPIVRSCFTSTPRREISRILVSEHERTTAQLNPSNLQKSLVEFHKNGLVILENAVATKSTDHILQRVLQDFNNHCRPSNTRWNQGRNSGNISLPIPTLPEYLHEDVWANRLAVQIMEYIIGPRPQLSLATSNIVLPKSSGRQAVHSDYYCEHADFPVFLEVNIYLQDVSARNGATEFWLGTHNGYSKADHSSPTTGWIKREVFCQRANVSPPIQPAIPKGSLLIRDLRCWHAGRENSTNHPRVIMGLLYNPRWFDSQMRMKLPRSAQPILQSWTHLDCLHFADFVPGTFNYLDHLENINLMPGSAKNLPYIAKQTPVSVSPEDYWTPP